MSWQKKFDGTAERLAARHADKINNAMSKGIDIARIVRAWLETQPSVNTTREQAAVWVHHNVIPNTELLEEALKDIYVEGYALGQAFAATAYAKARLSIKKAAPTGPELRAAFETDWDNWKAGSVAQALKTEKPGALQYLFDQAAISEKTKIWKNSMDRLGVVMADTARAGLGVSTTQQAIIEAQIGWGFDQALKDPYKAMRIARTEINRAQSLATMDTYREYGLEKVEWLASEGECDICSGNMELGPQPIDFEWDSIEGGITEPPAHPNCLCTLMPALDNEPTGDEPLAKEMQDFMDGTNKDTQRAHTRLEILPNATDPLISDKNKYVDVPWATIPTPKIDPSSWNNATIETIDLRELTATTEFLNRNRISKQIDADEQKGNATIVELAGRKIIIDGHERLMALWLLGLDEAPVWIVKE